MAILLSWCDAGFAIHEVCAWAGLVEAPRTGEAYRSAFEKGLAEVGLARDDVLAGFSDHEG